MQNRTGGVSTKARSLLALGVLAAVACVGVCCSDQRPATTTAPSGSTPRKLLALSEAKELIRASLPQALASYEAPDWLDVKEITTPQVWQRLGVQLYSVGYNYTFLIRGRRVALLHSGVSGGSVGDMCVTDLNDDGQLELVYIGQVSLSGVWYDGVFVLCFGQGNPRLVHILDGLCTSLRLRKTDDRHVEVEVQYHDEQKRETVAIVVGRVVLAGTDPEPRARVKLRRGLGKSLKERLHDGGPTRRLEWVEAKRGS